jgi:hypothetical protein
MMTYRGLIEQEATEITEIVSLLALFAPVPIFSYAPAQRPNTEVIPELSLGQDEDSRRATNLDVGGCCRRPSTLVTISGRLPATVLGPKTDAQEMYHG